MKNETNTQGDLYIEGSIRQLKNLLKSHLLVKPACMFDSNIQVKFHVSFATNGKYNDKNTRETTVQLASIQTAAIRSEFDHEYKYRFLVKDDSNNVTPLYDKNQIVNGGAGDLMLTFTGHAGSGLEYCDPVY